MIQDDSFWDIKIYIQKFDILTDRKIMFKEYFVQGRDETDEVIKYD